MATTLEYIVLVTLAIATRVSTGELSVITQPSPPASLSWVESNASPWVLFLLRLGWTHRLRAVGRVQRHRRAAWLVVAVALAILLAPAPLPAATTQSNNDACLTCHANPTLQPTHRVQSNLSLFIDSELLAGSEHRGMACLDCHVDQTTTLPHPAKKPRFCLDCHRGDSASGRGAAFGAIEQGFKASIHWEHAPQAFKCTQCHNPHTFKRDITKQGILAHNRVCLRCHGSADEFGALVNKAPPDLDAAHQWLPNRDLHWQHVRCLDCHSSYEPMSSHIIVAKALAVHNCESCHSSNSILTLKLYHYRRTEEVKQLGFLNAAIINDAYVFGATRNFYLDFAAISATGATMLAVALHGLLRLLAGKKRDARTGGLGGHG